MGLVGGAGCLEGRLGYSMICMGAMTFVLEFRTLMGGHKIYPLEVGYIIGQSIKVSSPMLFTYNAELVTKTGM